MTVYPTEQAPALELSTINGGKVTLSKIAQDSDFTLVVFYRGVFCPLCKMQMQDIEQHYQQLVDANMKVLAMLMDTEENATHFANDIAAAIDKRSLHTTIANGLTEKQAREWGLYISAGRDGSAEPAVFSEPGLFVIQPDNAVLMANTQSAPFSPPGIEQLIGGLSFAKANNYPARETLTVTAPALEK